MAILRPCLDCGQLAEGTRCGRHERIHQAKRLEAEPWRKVYDLREWTRASVAARRRDGWRCTFSAEGRRCPTTNETGLLSVHHVVKLRVIWERFGRPYPKSARWAEFVRSALDPSKLVTLCSRHHIQADSSRYHPPPVDSGTSGHRRHLRHARSRTRKTKNQQQTYTRDRPREDE